MDRRQFLTWVGVGALASSLPMALAACNQTEEVEEAQETQEPQESPEIDKSVREDGFRAIATTEQLEADGTVLERGASKPVLVFLNPQTKEIAALNPMCPHQACSVELKAEENAFACPCHGSKFALDGQVTNGPATKPLESFEVKQEENVVLVKVS